MAGLHGVKVLVFDVLGTMVDEPGGLRAAIAEAVPDADESAVAELLSSWQHEVDRQQSQIAEQRREYADSVIIDREAARRVAEQVGLSDEKAITRLSSAGQRLGPWADSRDGLARLAQHYPVVGLSNASNAALLRLNQHAGLRWHQVLSAELVRAYKPDPAVYQLALTSTGCAPDQALMIAAHAWDLRGAQAVGMRTAYVQRPVGDPPKASDAFDLQVSGLEELTSALDDARQAT